MQPSFHRVNLPIECGSACKTTVVSTVIIDSLNGYQQAMPEEQSLILHMHELLQYLNRQGHRDLRHRGATWACWRYENAR